MEKQTVQLKEDELLALVDKNRALDATYKLIEIILGTNDFDEMTQKIADIIPMALGYELAILWLVDEQQHKLTAVSISQTVKIDDVVNKLRNSLKNSSIALGYEDNLCVSSQGGPHQGDNPRRPQLGSPARRQRPFTRLSTRRLC